jgi:hypothetical protein
MRRAARDGMRGSGGGVGMTRRQTLGAAGAGAAGLFLAGAGTRWAGLGGGDDDEALAAAAKTCLRLTPEQEEGPFYVDLGRVRADVVEGQEGVPLDLRVRVIDHERCVPVANAAVDIWQCNADGVYSDEQSEGTVGQEYLRGIQFTDTAGWAELKTDPYDTSTVARVPNAQDRVYTQQGGKRSMPKLGGTVGAGITAKIALGVDPSTTPAGVGM